MHAVAYDMRVFIFMRHALPRRACRRCRYAFFRYADAFAVAVFADDFRYRPLRLRHFAACFAAMRCRCCR